MSPSVGRANNAETVSDSPVAAFLFDLIQDVSVLRPIIRTLALRGDLEFVFLMSRQFEGRDKQWIWRAEIDELARDFDARLVRFETPLGAVQDLYGRRGILFSASESNLTAHAVNHHVFLSAPPSFVRVTVQHGYECVGFNQNREQTLAHGTAVRFAADILCGWVPRERLRHLCPSERDKYVELGPPMVLNRLFDQRDVRVPRDTGLVCENLHSVRMRTVGEFQSTYLATLLEFSGEQIKSKRKVAVRPHPGGQFLLKNRVELPQNVVLANKPMYKTDLGGFIFGISAPSSVLIDMVLAGIPTAVWSDRGSLIDTTSYAGLAKVTTTEDWTAFADEAAADPEPFLARQRIFLRRSGLDIEPNLIASRLSGLVDGILGRWRTADAGPQIGSRAQPKRVLLVANGIIPTLHISFLKPLAGLASAGALKIFTITEKEILAADAAAKRSGSGSAADFVRKMIDDARPDVAVFCRYSGPEVQTMAEHLRQAGVPVIFHIDDDLLNVPKELGEKKFLEHNRSERTSTVRYLLDNADFVYCSTPRLRQRFVDIGISRDMFAGSIYCSGEVVSEAENRAVRTIGFMGNDKTPELTALVPVLVETLRSHPDVRFELFGSMAMPPEFEEFGDRITATPPVSDYDSFVAKFRTLRWDIGLCPLHQTPFNVVKADTKWVDYTSIGAAVIASRDTAYDAACADGCGLLVDTLEDWKAAIDALIADPGQRFKQVTAAQVKLRERYSLERLTEQVLSVFDEATAEFSRASAEELLVDGSMAA
ncbi:glycosyltransferase [Novosphingobium olei]|uniref:glycosyltransferase n=1 Tax=Novosphingobium olei TaxID=2728851 RepID=UPI003084BC6F|nr:glycosyltransferase [Novosphingobium olei]